MKKFLIVTAIILSSFIVLFTSLILTYLIITRGTKLDAEKLVGARQNIIICDEEGNEISDVSSDLKNPQVFIEDLEPHTVNAFIASEDRSFYKHNGLNYKRMLKALYKNVVSGSFKEGASTISQQLIKNTHLSHDKTIKRKLKEIKLTRKLEKKYSKNEILEMYLNTIYFGHNCYGLTSAAKFYFDKKAEDLNLTESATIVGLLASPNNYSPFKNEEKCITRRNLVLKSMLDCKYISKETYEESVSSPLEAIKPTEKSGYDSYINGVFDELNDINFNYYEGCKIITYLDSSAQKHIENLNYECDNATIIIDNLSGGIKAYKSTIGDAKRQIGSTAKPLFVYAPAIEEKIISPHTKILDEKIDFGGYSPENYDKKYHGYVTVTESIKNSYNVPAVKTLNNLNLKKCEKYLSNMEIDLEDDEKNLSLALGSMKYGLSLKELGERYTVFANGGYFKPSRFIKQIISNDGKTLYENLQFNKPVFSHGTCSLMNEMLLETSKSGTAKMLKNLNFDVASKTGTCGNPEGNTDAYTVSYTSENTFAVWLGDKNNERLNITGGRDCTIIMKSILETFYKDRTPVSLNTTDGTVSTQIDLEEYEKNNKCVIADDACPKLNIITVKTLSDAAPKEKSTRFTYPEISTPQISVVNNTINLNLCQTKYYSYLVKRVENGKETVIYDGKWKETITDTPTEGYYTYTVTPYYFTTEKKYIGKEITLPTVSILNNSKSPQNKRPDIIHKDWYNQ